jgi:hypothetical protein
MSANTIDHTTLIRLAEAGLVQTAHVIGHAGGWSLLVQYGTTECALAAQRSRQVRNFRKLETLVDYLKGVGIARFVVDAGNYDARSVTATRRPDRAAALKDVHAAAAYTKWLKAEVQEALDDTGPTLPHDEAMRLVRAAIRRA